MAVQDLELPQVAQAPLGPVNMALRYSVIITVWMG